MENKEMSMMDILIETHKRLERQGPGSMEMTVKALSFIDNISKIAQTVDMGCGSGGQTMVLARNIPGKIIGVDQLPDLINVLNENTKKLKLEERVTGVVGSMESLSFPKEEFDLIWSEGAIDNIGFEKGLTHWYDFLKKTGYIAVTCPSWLTDEYPAEVQKFWADGGNGLDTVEKNIGVMQKCGYGFIASFTLPEECWTDNYFSPRQSEEQSLFERYAGNKTVEEYIESSKYEVELYSRYKQYYGYVFYIGKKV